MTDRTYKNAVSYAVLGFFGWLPAIKFKNGEKESFPCRHIHQTARGAERCAKPQLSYMRKVEKLKHEKGEV